MTRPALVMAVELVSALTGGAAAGGWILMLFVEQPATLHISRYLQHPVQ